MTSPHESSVADRDSTEIAKRSYRAYVDKDRSAIERLLAEDFHFTRASCFWVYAYPAFLRYAAHSAGGYWARISPQAWQMAS